MSFGAPNYNRMADQVWDDIVYKDADSQEWIIGRKTVINLLVLGGWTKDNAKAIVDWTEKTGETLAYALDSFARGTERICGHGEIESLCEGSH
jgi:hypothetical protein